MAFDPVPVDTAVRFGTVRAVAVDATTGKPFLDAVEYRFLGERRFAKLPGGAITARLTPDRYRLSVARRGYETLFLSDDLVVRDGEEIDLGRLGLLPGSASIVGQVRAPWAEPSQVVELRLRGIGRRPCRDCGVDDGKSSNWDRYEPCPRCGYTTRRTILTRRPGERFEFRHLAAGLYRLHAMARDPDGVATTVDVEVHSAGEVRRDVDLAAPARLRLHIAREDGVDFDGGWHDRWGRLHREEVELYVYVGERQVGTATFPLGDLVEPPALTAELLRDCPLVEAQLEDAYHTESSYVHGLRAQVDHARRMAESGVVDGERDSSSSLVEPGSFGRTPRADFSVARDPSGTLVVAGVPRAVVTVSATSGPYRSIEHVVDLRAGDAGLRIAMALEPGEVLGLESRAVRAWLESEGRVQPPGASFEGLRLLMELTDLQNPTEEERP